MERAILLTLLIALTAGMAAAQVAVIETATPEQDQEPTILISTAAGALTLTATTDVRDVHVLIDGKEAEVVESISAGDTITSAENLEGEHDVEVRYLRDLTYAWERPQITINDEQARLSYVEYDKDKDRVEFSITGADFVHPDHLGTTAEDTNEPFTGYQAELNDEKMMACYPRITTGKNLFFSCRSSDYANKLELTMTIGVRERAKIEAQAAQDNPAVELPPMPPPPPPAMAPVEEEKIPSLDNITMTDTIQEQKGISPVPLLILLLFLTVMVLLFVASHHKHESKNAGTHHPLKKKR